MTAKTDVVVKLTLVFFISLLSFSIGTFVGKKYSDNQHKLAALEPHGASREVASTHGAEDAHGSSDSGMSDEEIAKIAEEFAEDEPVASEKTGEGHHGEEHQAKASHDSHGDKPAEPAHDGHAVAESKPAKQSPKASALHREEPSKAAKNVAAGKLPTHSMVGKAKVESRLPSSLPKDVAHYSVGKFTVQIAAFAHENEAKKRAEDLKGKGYSAFYVPAKVKGKTWYRVSVGLFASEKEAKDYKVDFSEKSKIENTIIQKIAN